MATLSRMEVGTVFQHETNVHSPRLSKVQRIPYYQLGFIMIKCRNTYNILMFFLPRLQQDYYTNSSLTRLKLRVR